jgi:hypothetical protein
MIENTGAAITPIKVIAFDHNETLWVMSADQGGADDLAWQHGEHDDNYKIVKGKLAFALLHYLQTRHSLKIAGHSHNPAIDQRNIWHTIHTACQAHIGRTITVNYSVCTPSQPEKKGYNPNEFSQPNSDIIYQGDAVLPKYIIERSPSTVSGNQNSWGGTDHEIAMAHGKRYIRQHFINYNNAPEVIKFLLYLPQELMVVDDDTTVCNAAQEDGCRVVCVGNGTPGRVSLHKDIAYGQDGVWQAVKQVAISHGMAAEQVENFARALLTNDALRYNDWVGFGFGPLPTDNLPISTSSASTLPSSASSPINNLPISTSSASTLPSSASSPINNLPISTSSASTLPSSASSPINNLPISTSSAGTLLSSVSGKSPKPSFIDNSSAWIGRQNGLAKAGLILLACTVIGCIPILIGLLIRHFCFNHVTHNTSLIPS